MSMACLMDESCTFLYAQNGFTGSHIDFLEFQWYQIKSLMVSAKHCK